MELESMSCPQPALVDNSTEYFNIGSTRYVLSSGSVHMVSEFPASYRSLLRTELLSDRKAIKGLAILNIVDEEQRLQKFHDCNFSLFDSVPDVSASGKLGKREFIQCPSREICQAEGLLCKYPNDLTRKEILVVKGIRYGKMDAEIIHELKIKQNTLRTHKNKIERKIGFTGKTSIGVWAVENNIG